MFSWYSLYLEDPGFKYLSGDRLNWGPPTFPPMQMPYSSSSYTTTDFCPVSSSSFFNRPTIRGYVVWATDSITQYTTVNLSALFLNFLNLP